MVVMLFVLLLISCSSDDDGISGYGTGKIGDQRWMTENLNVNVSGSRCYNDDEAYCAKYGRLYNWAAAMALPDSCNHENCVSIVSEKHRGICPSGWHIPSDAEWKALSDSAGGSFIAGKYLKAKEGWRSCGKGDSYQFQCEDMYGFSALPGGRGYPVGTFKFAGEYGYWWSASEYHDDAYYRDLVYNSDAAEWYQYGDKSHFLSVRCVRD